MLFGSHYLKGNLSARMEGSAIDRMPFDAIQRIQAGEQAARENRADAVAEGERLLAEVRQEGRRLAERAKAQAEEQVKALFAQTEAAAAARREQALADNQVRCQRIKQEARGRLEQAARLIMERIGNVCWPL